MMKLLWLAAFILSSIALAAQGFEVAVNQDNIKGTIGETLKSPIRFKNLSDKTLTIIVKKVSGQIGSTQKNFYCLDNNCQDAKVEDFILKIEPGHSLNSLQIALEAGLVPGESLVKYIAYNKYNPTDYIEFNVGFTVDEKPEKQHIYTSKQITLYDVYPNPATESAFVDYRIFNNQIKSKVMIHNILGNKISEYDLPFQEYKVKVPTQELNPGIYFYSLYIDNECVMTRKLIVKN